MDVLLSWGGSRGGSGGSAKPPKVKHNTLLFLVKKDFLNNNIVGGRLLEPPVTKSWIRPRLRIKMFLYVMNLTNVTLYLVSLVLDLLCFVRLRFYKKN